MIEENNVARKLRGKYTPSFKAKIALLSMQSDLSLNELSVRFDLHPSQISIWKNQLIKRADLVFHPEIQRLLRVIGPSRLMHTSNDESNVTGPPAPAKMKEQKPG